VGKFDEVVIEVTGDELFSYCKRCEWLLKDIGTRLDISGVVKKRQDKVEEGFGANN
jgi:hypothetical protein